MRKTFALFRDYFCYCGLSREEYRALKPDAYESNFNVWRWLHRLMAAAFAVLCVSAYLQRNTGNLIQYSVMVLYSVAMSLLFAYSLKPRGLAGQLLIYLTMVLLLLNAGWGGLQWTQMKAVAFPVVLVILPMFMIDKPYFMAILLSLATAGYVVCAAHWKQNPALEGDILNNVLFCLLGIVINIFYNSVRVREFSLNRQIARQRDTDDLTGLMSKRALTAAIDRHLTETDAPGIILFVDMDHMKVVNDTYGHDMGDALVAQTGRLIGEVLGPEAVKGRFGGDEFIGYLPGTDDVAAAEALVQGLTMRVNTEVKTPNTADVIGISVGLALRNPTDRSYQTLFKKADLALYQAKETGRNRCVIYGA